MHRRRLSSLLIALAVMVASLAAALPVAAAQVAPIGIGPITFSVTPVAKQELRDGRLGIVIDVIGVGVIDCLDNQACVDAGLHGTQATVSQAIEATFDAETHRISGRIVIDVISAGFSATFKGWLRGTLTDQGGGIWALAITERARATSGDWTEFELSGLLDRAAGALVGSPTGTGLISTTEAMD